MQGTHIWYQFYLHGRKIIWLALLVGVCSSAYGQSYKWARKNNPNYDERKISYGFVIGLHSSRYQIKYSDAFVVTPDFDTLHSVTPAWSGGFSLGFLVNLRLTDLLDLRMTPKVTFYQNKMEYRYTNNKPTEVKNIETTMVEFPLLLKYKSERRGNIRMFMIGGVSPGIEASGRKNLEAGESTLEVLDYNVSLEAGFGLDLYYPLFKFSPEIRFSRGMIDILNNRSNIYGVPLSRVNTNTITVYLIFQ